MTVLRRVRSGGHSVVVITILSSVIGVVGLFVLFRVINGISTNTGRIDKVEAAFCDRLQRERDERNRIGAIVYKVLTTVKGAEEYNRLGRLPRYQPPTDCKQALEDPENYEPPEPIPFSDLSTRRLERLLMTPRIRN